MKAFSVSIAPTEAAKAAGRPELVPELLASVFARFSRSADGIESILSRVLGLGNTDKSIDSIFKMVDYGHRSIADMVPVAIVLSGITQWLAYLVWSLCATAGGQEWSTRYLKLSLEGLASPDDLGIPVDRQSEWRTEMEQAFRAYGKTLAHWEAIALANPELIRIPAELQNDTSDKAKRARDRIAHNYAFDRSRYMLPAACCTDIGLIMSARAWVELCQYLLSHQLLEPRRLGELIKEELTLSAPRLIRHAVTSESQHKTQKREFDRLVKKASDDWPSCLTHETDAPTDAPCIPSLRVDLPMGVTGQDLAEALQFHTNRYDPVGNELARTAVRLGWTAVALAEIRDLNRHRTGTKYCPTVPQGFYHASDQLPPGDHSSYRKLGEVGRKASINARRLLEQGEATYVYHVLLGTQFPFEHTTTGDKFAYEAELRTGTGAHFRYAGHLRESSELWFKLFPETRGLIQIGSAEPE